MKDPPIAPLKPRFPDWMRRLDPHLACEDHNAVHEAFRLLGRSRRLGTRFRGRDLVYLAGGIMMVLVTVFLFFFIGCCALLLPALVWLPIAHVRSQSKITGGAFPRSVGAVFSPTGFHEQGAVDLWLSGARGRDILEAIYLESRRHSLVAPIVFTTVCALALVGGGHAAWQAMLASGAVTFPMIVYFLLAAAMLMWLLLEVFFLVWILDKGDKVRRAVDNRILVWRGEAVWPIVAWHAFLDILGFLSLLVILVAVETLAWIGATALFLNYLEVSTQVWWHHVVPGLVIVNSALLAGVTALLRIALGRYFNYTAENLLRRADHAFEYFMGRKVVEDPDVYLWNIGG